MKGNQEQTGICTKCGTRRGFWKKLNKGLVWMTIHSCTCGLMFVTAMDDKDLWITEEKDQ